MRSDSTPRGTPRRSGRTLAVALVVAVVLVYAGVIALYAANDRLATIQGCTEDPPADAILLSLNPESVDAAADRLKATMTVVSFGPVASEDTQLLSDPLTVLVSDNDGPRTFRIAADEIPSPQALSLITNGFVERWPFDAHSVDVAFVSLQTAGEIATPIPTVLCGSVHVPGWAFTSEEVPGTDEVVIDGEPVTQLRITATRSAATVAFGMVILVLMAILPALGLTVSIYAYRGLRKVEPTLMSWMAAMLFATIPLRTFLPGSPPVGSWVDYLVVLWVVAGLVLTLVIYVAAWLRWGPPGGAGTVGTRGGSEVVAPAVAVAPVVAATPVAAASDSVPPSDADGD